MAQAVHVEWVPLELALLCSTCSKAEHPSLPLTYSLVQHTKSFLFRICDFAIDLLGNKSMPMSLKGQADQKKNRQVDVEGFFFPLYVEVLTNVIH